MKTDKTKRQWTSTTSKKMIDSSNTSVSVFTKTINPKLVIESENIEAEHYLKWKRDKHKLLKFLCLIVMCVIILITFFLSLNTYNMVHELSKYFIS